MTRCRHHACTRADTTPQVARIAATRLSAQARPLRLCYAGQVLRVRAGMKPIATVPNARPTIDVASGEEAKAQLVYYPTVTREDFATPGRITDRIKSGDVFADLQLPIGFSPNSDRVMLCGSMAMIKETGELLESYGLKEGSNAEPGDYVLERAFVG